MSYLNINIPPFPYYFFSGNALYRPGDSHNSRKGIPCFDLIAVEQGTLYLSLKNDSYVLKENDILIIPPELPHRGSRVCKERTFFHWLHFSVPSYEISDTPNSAFTSSTSSFRSNTYTLSLPIYQTLTEKNASHVFSLMAQLETQTINFYDHSLSLTKSRNNPLYQQELFMELLQILTLRQKYSSKNDIGQVVMQYMNTHYADNITLESLAKIANCHPTHLIRCMKSQYNLSPMQMLIHIRLRHATTLLLDPRIPITTISQTVGFSSASYFGKQFKKAYGCSPKEYRKSNLISS